MANPGKARLLLESIDALVPLMTDEEIGAIGRVLLTVTERLEKEDIKKNPLQRAQNK